MLHSTSQTLQHNRAGRGARRGVHGAGAAALHLAGLPRVRRHAGPVRAHRRVLRLLRARPARPGRVPDGRAQDAGAADIAVPRRQLRLWHYAAGLAHGNLRVRNPGAVRHSGRGVLGGGLQLGRAAHLPRPPAHDALPVPADAVRPASSDVRLGLLHHLLVDVAADSHLRPGAGLQPSDGHQCPHRDPGGVSRVRFLHLRGRDEGGGVDRRGADGVHAHVHLPGGHPRHHERGRRRRGHPAQHRLGAHRAARPAPGPVRASHHLGLLAGGVLLAERELRAEPVHDAALPRAARPRQGQEGGGAVCAGDDRVGRRVHVLRPARLRHLPRLRPRHHEAGPRQGPGAAAPRHGHPRHVPGTAGPLRGGRLQRGAELAVHGAQLDGRRRGGGLLAAAGQDAADRGPRQRGHAAGGRGVRRCVRRPGVRRGEARRGAAADGQPQRHQLRPRAGRFLRGRLHALGQRHVWNEPRLVQGCLAGSGAALAFMSWLVFGAQHAIARGDLVFPEKPVSVEGCTYSFNATTPLEGVAYQPELPFWLFRVSYQWYPVIGAVVSLAVSTAVSLVFKDSEPVALNPRLFSPVIRRYLKPSETKPGAKTTADFAKGIKESTL